MRTEAFDYDLPRELIAQHPVARRDEARLLVLDRAADAIEHRRFGDIVCYLEPGDLLVLNDTRVIPARLVGRRATGGRVEFLLIAPHGERPGPGALWRAIVKCRGRLQPDEAIALEGGALSCRYRGRTQDGESLVAFAGDAASVWGSRAVWRSVFPSVSRWVFPSASRWGFLSASRSGSPRVSRRESL